MKQQSSISSWLADHELELIQTADYIFQHPELAYKEELSSKYLSNYLEQQGFHISKETAGISTAFTAEWGHGKPVLGFLAEYDALAELGHACGHNLMCAIACGAGIGLKSVIDTLGGKITVLGTPLLQFLPPFPSLPLLELVSLGAQKKWLKKPSEWITKELLLSIKYYNTKKRGATPSFYFL